MLLVIHTSERKMWQHDTSLSLQAKGLMLVLTTNYENNSTIDRQELLSHFTNSDASLRSALEMLRWHDYFRLSRIKATDGRYFTTVWEVFDEPSSERLDVEATITINGQSQPLKLITT